MSPTANDSPADKRSAGVDDSALAKATTSSPAEADGSSPASSLAEVAADDSHTPRAQVAAAVRRERQRAGLTLSEVARRAGIGKSTMSGLEAGTANPSLETMWALAAALDIPLSRLLDPPQHEVALLRTKDMPSLASTASNYVATLLSTSPANARRDIYLIQAEPGEPRISRPHPAGTIEHIIVGRGAVQIEVLGETYELHAGDYLTYPGDQPHTYTALESGTNTIFVVESY